MKDRFVPKHFIAESGDRLLPDALYTLDGEPCLRNRATEDAWADPASEYLSLIHAAPVYRLFGYEGLGAKPFPRPDSPVFGDRIAYHLRTGKHDLTVYDWERFMDFADRELTSGYR